MINQDDMDSKMLSFKGLFFNVSINMVEIMKICDNITHKMNFVWYGSDEFEIIGSKTSKSSSSEFLVDEENANFTLIPEQPTI